MLRISTLVPSLQLRRLFSGNSVHNLDSGSSLALQPMCKRKIVDDDSARNSDVKLAKSEHEVAGSGGELAENKDDIGFPIGKKVKKNRGVKREWSGRKRRGTRLEGGEAGATQEQGDTDAEKAPRLPKRTCALLIGFCGSGYRGMQIQPDVNTIENVLFKALVTAGAVSKDNADDPVKVGLQRAARTDAGVHAAGNVVSLKMITNVPGIPDLVARINEELPPDIRLWSFLRVQNSFNARLSCDSRRYTYFFPSYLLIPPKPTTPFYQSISRQSAASSNPTSIEPDSFWQDVNLDTTREEDMVRKKAWKVSRERVEALREAAKRFEGTHNFHNFTVGRDVKDRSCWRHMKKIEVADPVEYDGTEWISVLLHGQSFMLHQRKMMCVLVTAVRTGTPSSIISALYGPELVAVPKMPSLGLLLENPIFDSYNNKIDKANKEKKFEPGHPDYRDALSFDKHANEMLKFKEEHIYSRMRESEERVQIFDRWQNVFDLYNGNDFLYYNAQGIIPEAATIKRGERRPNPFREQKRFDATDFTTNETATALADETEEQEAESESEEEKMGKKELEEAEG